MHTEMHPNSVQFVQAAEHRAIQETDKASWT